MAVTVVDKVSGLLGRLGVDDTAETGRTVGRAVSPSSSTHLRLDHSTAVRDHTYKNPADACRPADHLLRKVGLEFIDVAIEEGLEDGVHVVRCTVIVGKQVIQICD